MKNKYIRYSHNIGYFVRHWVGNVVMKGVLALGIGIVGIFASMHTASAEVVEGYDYIDKSRPDIKFYGYGIFDSGAEVYKDEEISILANANGIGRREEGEDGGSFYYPQCTVYLDNAKGKKQKIVTITKDKRLKITPDLYSLGKNTFVLVCDKDTKDGKVYGSSWWMTVVDKTALSVDKETIPKYGSVVASWNAPRAMDDRCRMFVNEKPVPGVSKKSGQVTLHADDYGNSDLNIHLKCLEHSKSGGTYYDSHRTVKVDTSSVDESRRPFAVIVGDTVYENTSGDISVPLDTPVKISWNVPNADSCSASLDQYRPDVKTSDTLTFDSINWSQTFELRCRGTRECQAHEECGTETYYPLRANIRFKAMDATGGEVTGDRAILSFYATKQDNIAIGETVTLNWFNYFKIKKLTVPATECSIRVSKVGDATFSKYDADFDRGKLQSTASNNRVFYPVVFDSPGEYKAVLTCKYPAPRHYIKTSTITLNVVDSAGGNSSNNGNNNDSSDDSGGFVSQDSASLDFQAVASSPDNNEMYTVSLQWKTTGKDYCLITGDTTTEELLQNKPELLFEKDGSPRALVPNGNVEFQTPAGYYSFTIRCLRHRVSANGVVQPDTKPLTATKTVGNAPTATDGTVAFSIKEGTQTVAPGQHFTLQWNAPNRTFCTASGAWSANDVKASASDATTFRIYRTVLKPQGEFTVPGITADSTYTITCSNAFGLNEVSASITVKVQGDTTQQTDSDAPAFAFTVNGASDSITVAPGSDLSIAWNYADDRSHCRAYNGWTVAGIKAIDESLVKVVEGKDKLTVKGSLTWSNFGSTAASGDQVVLALDCWRVGTNTNDTRTVIITFSDTGTTTDPADTSGDPSTAGTFISSFDVTPESVESGGSVTATWAVVDKKPMRCRLVASQRTSSGSRAIELIPRAVYYEATAYSKTFALHGFEDGTVHVSLACYDLADATITEVRTKDVRVGGTAGIRYFTANKPHLTDPGYVLLSWDFYGMKSCKVSRKGMENNSAYVRARAAVKSIDLQTWSSQEELMYVDQTTEFTLTCTPRKSGEAEHKKTLTVVVGDHIGTTAVDGTENAQYINYCPFKTGSSRDIIVRFTQRLEWAGQKDVISGITIPRGVYEVYLSASDSFDGRHNQDQPNERYYVAFYGKNGEAIVQTNPTTDLKTVEAQGHAEGVGRVVLSQDAYSVAAVHSDGENASLNPGCMLAKYVGSVDTENTQDKDVVQTACTADVKLCADGRTYVGRDPKNNCEFRQCPNDTTTTTTGTKNTTTTTIGASTEVGTSPTSPVSPVTRDLRHSCETRVPSELNETLTNGAAIIDVYCDGGSPIAVVGEDRDTIYTWNTAYYTTDGSNFTNSVPVSGTMDSTGQWVIGRGEIQLPADGGQQYVATYTCKRSGNQWQCGCTGSGVCSDPAAGRFIWYVAGYETAVSR